MLLLWSASSIRVPAALNGVVGLKPTYGLVPRHGVTSLSWSLDRVGPVRSPAPSRTRPWSWLSSPGTTRATPPHWPPAVDHRPERDPDLTGVRIGVPGNYCFDHVDPEVAATVHRAIAQLEVLGARRPARRERRACPSGCSCSADPSAN
ncbi:amidase family protein [Streptomyces sp. NPDC001832]|uniref:amidase family protein n=1 Tax=Streptomyces sp. NPDC001832 TaxID=3154527 RepID=UPI0033170EC2